MERSKIWQAILDDSKSKNHNMSEREHVNYANLYIMALVSSYTRQNYKQWSKHYYEYLMKNPDKYVAACEYADRHIIKIVEQLTIDDLTIFDIIELRDANFWADDEFGEKMPDFLEIKLRELSEEHYQKNKRKQPITPAVEKIMNSKVENIEFGRLGLPSDRQYQNKGRDRLKRKRRK